MAALLTSAPSQTPATCEAIPTLGPAAAPIVVRWYLDPVVTRDLSLWFEIHRLIGDLQGEVAFAPVLVASATHRAPAEERVRAWSAAAACNGRAEAALRLLAREGTARISRRLAEAEGRRELAKLAGIAAERLDDPQLDALIERGTAELRARIRGSSGRAGRPPAFVIDGGAVFEDGARLEAVRRAIESHRRRDPPGIRSVAKLSRRGVSLRLTRPPADAGMLVGGVALPHRVVLLADQEDHPDFILLSAVADLRARVPGWLAIQVIARGQSRASERLRQRLCGAAAIGRELDYLRVLTRQAPNDENADALRERLDRAAEDAACATEEASLEPTSDGALGLPSGLWLDGAALGQRELAALEREILAIEATASPLDAVFSAAAPPEP
jgi:hypothetical protein